MERPKSRELFARAKQLMPGGVNSPVRAFKSVGGEPIFIERAEGAHLFDVDGNKYLDFVCSWGPLILGHAHPAVVNAVKEAAIEGTSFGAATLREIELSERIISAVPTLEKVRFTSSGTEAAMSALRLARGFTGRDKIIKFSGCYHGHADPFLVEAGSGVATLGIPGSVGVTTGTAKDTLTVAYNDLDGVRALMEECGSEIAAIMLEPIACNMGMVKPEPGFLQGLREICDQYGSVLFFDEVITGFRVGLGGAQELYGVMPDMSAFGKVIGSGLPVGAYGGRADIMNWVAPSGPVYQAGTLSGNPLAMAAGKAAFDVLAAPGFYEELEKKGAFFESLIRPILDKYDQPAHFERQGSLFYMWFKENASNAPKNYDEIKTGSPERYGKFFWELMNRGVYLAPSAFEVGFISAAHQESDLEFAASAIDEAFAALSA